MHLPKPFTAQTQETSSPDKEKAPKLFDTDTDIDTVDAKKDSIALYDVISKALISNPDIMIADARKEDAWAGLEVEKTKLSTTVDLTVTGGIENTQGNDTNVTVLDRAEANLAINKTLTDFGKTKNTIEQRERLFEAAMLQGDDTSEEITLEIMRAYLNYLRHIDLNGLSTRNVKAHKKIARLIEIREEGGETTKADVKRSTTRLDSAQSAKLENGKRLKDAANTFLRLTDTHPKSIKRPKRFLRNLGGSNEGYSTKEAISLNPKLRALAAQRDAIEKQIDSQKASALPELFVTGDANVKYNVSGETGMSKDARIMLGVRWRIFDGGRNASQVEQYQARLSEAEARKKKLYDNLTENYDKSLETIATNKKKTSFLNESVSAARQVIDLYNQQFESGSRKPLELLDAQRDLQSAEQAHINHVYDSAIAAYQALRLKGELVDHIFAANTLK